MPDLPTAKAPRATFARMLAATFDGVAGAGAVCPNDIPAEAVDVAFSRYMLALEENIEAPDAMCLAVDMLSLRWRPDPGTVERNRPEVA